jgi:hypothetical protein
MTQKEYNRQTAKVVGISILIAYGVLSSSFTESIPVIVFFELISGIAVMLMAVLLIPVFSPYGKIITLWFAVPRITEGIFLSFAAFLYLPNNNFFLELHGWAYRIHPYIFVLTGLLFYYLFYKSVLVPRFISIWGIIALFMLLAVNLLEITGNSSPLAMLLYFPIVLNEVFLAIWLIIKGFNPPAITGNKP